MVIKRGILLAAIGAALLWSGFTAAQSYRPEEFLNLDLSKAVLSPAPLGPATSFTPGPLDVRVDRGNKATQADAELVVDPKAVPAETVHAESKSAANVEPAHRVAPRMHLAHGRAERAAAPRKPRALVALHGRNPVEAQARDTRIQVWPCRSGGICNWKR
ncbi:hypothetical protein [Bradyrhizobium sp.]|uniref:hypothetical protein n=1 Tax=Bradyrhizobium sp. TaxID=376 RepID=UPI00262E9426|nr:hypothetical protein [Bradyrhizobium sp.]